MRSHFESTVIAAAIATACLVSTSGAHEFTDENVFLAYVKLIEPQDMTPYVEVFSERFAPSSSTISNEFAAFDQAANAAKVLDTNLAAFDLEETFVVSTTAGFGEYSFEESAFAFRPVSAGSSFESGQGFGPMGKIQVTFQNTRDFAGLPMGAEQAKLFVEGKREWDRKVAIDIEFSPVSSLEGSERIRADIVQIDVYSDSSRNSLIYTMRPTVESASR